MLDFPSSPTLDQVFGNYKWNGYAWAPQPSGNFVAKTGDTMTGTLNIAPATGGAYINLDPVQAAQQSMLNFMQSGAGKWQLGRQAASDQFLLYDNAAGISPIVVSPNNGGVWLTSTIPSTSPTNGALQVAGGVGIGGVLNVGGDFRVAGGNFTVNGTTGAIQSNGGIGTNGIDVFANTAVMSLHGKTSVGGYSLLNGTSNFAARWRIYFPDMSAEDAANNGGDFRIDRFGWSAGVDNSHLGTALLIKRSDGSVTIDNTLAAGGPGVPLDGAVGKLQTTTRTGDWAEVHYRVGADTSYPSLGFAKTRGTTPSEHVDVVAGADILGGVDVYGSAGAKYGWAGGWYFYCGGTPGAAPGAEFTPGRYDLWTVGLTGTSGMRFSVLPEGEVKITSNAASTSTTTGALQVAGGAGIGGALNVGGLINANGVNNLGSVWSTGAGYTTLMSPSGASPANLVLGGGGDSYLRGDATYLQSANGGTTFASFGAGNATISLPLSALRYMAAPGTDSVIGDLTVARDANSGVLHFGTAKSSYLFFDGTKYLMLGGPLYLNGDLSVNKPNPLLLLNKAASGQSCWIRGATNGVTRWQMNFGNTTAETGGNAGSNFSFYRYDDAGNQLGPVMLVDRNEGRIALEGDPISALHAATKQYVDNKSANKSPFIAHPNAEQSLPNEVFTKINFGSAGINQGGYYNPSNSRWTPPAGHVQIGANVYFNSGLSAPSAITVAIYKNGLMLARTSNATSTAYGGGAVSLIDVCNGVDYYEIFVYVYTATTAGVANSSIQTWFTGAML